jgi:mono/diheme cytochrome c family protein
MALHTPIGSSNRGVPLWAIWLIVVALLVGGVYVLSNLAGENPTVARPNESGAPVASGGGAGEAQALIQQAACQGCHGSDWSGGVGPALTDIASGPQSPNLAALAEAHPNDWPNVWIAGVDPSISDPALRGGMPAFGGPPYEFSDEQIQSIVDYLKGL